MADRYFLLNKPFNMVSQFVSSHDVPLLGQLDFDFPEGTHAIGRLDKDSEGLLLLTTDKKVTRLVFLGEQPHKRSYLVMVQHEITSATFQKLKQGVSIKIKGGVFYNAIPDDIEIVENPLSLYPYAEDHRTKFPHTWLKITLTEGKYHQVRKMFLSVKHRVIRLIRLNMENLHLENLPPGEVLELSREDFYNSANINNKS